jgi:hypothetical protein
MAESQRTGRISFVLFNPQGKEVQVWSKAATLELRDELAPMLEEFKAGELQLREDYPDFYAYSRIAVSDPKAGMAMLAERPNIQDQSKEVTQRQTDMDIRNSFRLVKQIIDMADANITPVMREGIAEPTDGGDFWRRQPIEEVREAAARFRKIAGIRG